MKKKSRIAVVAAIIMTMALSLVSCGEPKKWDELQTQYKTLVELHNEVTDLYKKKGLDQTNPELGQSINESAAVINKVGEKKSTEVDDKECEDLINDINKSIDYYKQTKENIEKMDTSSTQDATTTEDGTTDATTTEDGTTDGTTTEDGTTDGAATEDATTEEAQ